MYVVNRLSCDQTMYHILAKWNNLRLTYSDFKIKNLGTVPHLDFYSKYMDCNHCAADMHHIHNFSKIDQPTAALYRFENED